MRTILGAKDRGGWFGQPNSNFGIDVAQQALTSLNSMPAPGALQTGASAPPRVLLTV